MICPVTMMLAAVCLVSACGSQRPLQSPEHMPEVYAWCKGMRITMGADTGCAMPAVVFPVAANELGSEVKWGLRHQASNLEVSLSPDGAGWKNCPVIHSFFATSDGLIGWPALKRYVWHLNPEEGIQTLQHSLPPEVREWDSVPIAEGNCAVLNVPGVGECLLDTGAPHAVYIPRELWKEFRNSVPPSCRVGYFHGESPAAGGNFVIEVLRVPTFRLGRLTLQDVTVCQSFSNSPMVILGMECLRGVEVWIDGPGRKLYYRPLVSEPYQTAHGVPA